MKPTKNQTEAVRAYLESVGFCITHVQAMEVIARGEGHRSRAALINAPANVVPEQPANKFGYFVKDKECAIQMKSGEYGTEVFEYSSEEERLRGLFRLMKKAQALADDTHREYYFCDIEVSEETFDTELCGEELAAEVFGDGSIQLHIDLD